MRFGVDVGGTKCLGVALDDDGRIERSHRVPTGRGADGVLAAIGAVVDGLGADHRHGTLGIGIAGLVTRDGVVRSSPNLPAVVDLDVAAAMSTRFGAPVAVDNDATCALVAEWNLGAATGCTDVVMVTLGTGIGGAFVADGAVRHGRHGFAGEFGHMVVDPDGPDCVCGRRGCWERYASGAGLAALGRRAVAEGRAPGLAGSAGGDPDRITGEMVAAWIATDSSGTEPVADEFCRWVALGLVNLANALDPEMFVVGGGLSPTVGAHLDRIRRSFADLLYAPGHRPHPDLVVAGLGESSGAVGAALIGSDRRRAPD